MNHNVFNILGSNVNQTSPEFKVVTGAKPRKSRAKRSELSISSATPVRPRWLSAAARQEWTRIVPMLAERGTLTQVDTMTLAIYCETVARYQQALHSVQTDGLNIQVTVLDSGGKAHVTTKPNPALKILESAQRDALRLLREMGATPRSRELTRPAKSAPKKKDGTVNLLEAMKARNAR